ncbi:MAG TPA: hypothetical protein VK750_09535 [Cytophagaceae bacterium]|nr:hypothetical protein [Cytophagaceae bacterium]
MKDKRRGMYLPEECTANHWTYRTLRLQTTERNKKITELIRTSFRQHRRIFPVHRIESAESLTNLVVAGVLAIFVTIETVGECMASVWGMYGLPYAFRMRSVWKVYGKYIGDTWEVYEIGYIGFLWREQNSYFLPHFSEIFHPSSTCQ